MNLLLDSHSFLWFVTGDGRLSRKARRVIEHGDSTVLLSAASVWELAIKHSLGRLELPSPFPEYMAEKVQAGIRVVPVELAHAMAVAALPFHHRDPFDRLIIAQAMCEHLPIVTSDKDFRRYDGITLIW